MGGASFGIMIQLCIYIFEFIIAEHLFQVFWEKKESLNNKIILIPILAFPILLTILNHLAKSDLVRISSIALLMFVLAKLHFEAMTGSIIYVVTILLTTGLLSEGIAELIRVIFHIYIPPSVDEYGLDQVLISVIGKMIWFSSIQILIHIKYLSKRSRDDGKIGIILFPAILIVCMYEMVSHGITYGLSSVDLIKYILIGIAGLASCLITDRLYDYSRERYELANQLARKQAEESYTEALEQNEKLLQNKHHEFKNIIITMQGMLCEDCKSSVDAFLNQPTNVAAKGVFLMVTSDYHNKVINSIINYYKDQCFWNKIEFDVDIQYFDLAFLQPIDTAILLGNALMNAYEACLRVLPNHKKWIKLKICKINEDVVIGIRNSKNPNHHVPANNIHSTKANAVFGGHGLGMNNIMDRAVAYRGKVAYADNGDEFVLTIRVKSGSNNQ